MSLHPIGLLRREWAVIARSPESAIALKSLAEVEGAVASLGAADLGDLVDALSARSGRLDPVSADRVVGAMVRSQHVDVLVARAVVQALVPGLLNVAERLGWGRGGPWVDAEAFASDLVTTAWEVIRHWAGRTREYMAAALLSAVRCRLWRQAVAHRRELARLERRPVDELAHHVTTRGGRSTLEDLARSLEEAMDHAAGDSDTALVYAHRVLGYSLAELAQLTGRTRKQLEYRRDRAEGLLCAS